MTPKSENTTGSTATLDTIAAGKLVDIPMFLDREHTDDDGRRWLTYHIGQTGATNGEVSIPVD